MVINIFVTLSGEAIRPLKVGSASLPSCCSRVPSFSPDEGCGLRRQKQNMLFMCSRETPHETYPANTGLVCPTGPYIRALKKTGEEGKGRWFLPPWKQ